MISKKSYLNLPNSSKNSINLQRDLSLKDPLLNPNFGKSNPSIIPRRVLIINKLVDDIIDKKSKLIKSIFNKLPNDKLIKNIIYMNKNSNIGKCAMIYSSRLDDLLKNTYLDEIEESLEDALKNPKYKNTDKDLINFFLNPISEEYDDNEYLNSTDKEYFKNKIALEELIIEFLIEKLSLSFNKKIPDKIISEDYKNCKHDVCLLDKSVIVEPSKDFIWIIGIDQYLFKSWCFKLPDLLLILLTNTMKLILKYIC